MKQIRSATSYDYMPYTAVPVIASFDNNGHVRPLYVRIDGEPHKIDSCFVRYAFAGQTEFNCKVVCEDKLLPLTLTYYQKECLWIVQQV